MTYYFSSNMRKRRLELGMSQAQLGNAVGVSQNTISEYETDVRYPTIDKVYDIAKALETKAEILICATMYPIQEKTKRVHLL